MHDALRADQQARDHETDKDGANTTNALTIEPREIDERDTCLSLARATHLSPPAWLNAN